VGRINRLWDPSPPLLIAGSPPAINIKTNKKKKTCQDSRALIKRPYIITKMNDVINMDNDNINMDSIIQGS
jgi:hypothetical protein